MRFVVTLLVEKAANAWYVLDYKKGIIPNDIQSKLNIIDNYRDNFSSFLIDRNFYIQQHAFAWKK
jgi:hypothetical protein